MSANLNVFDHILTRYKFRQPVPQPVQDYMLASRDQVLRDTLKKLNQYSLFYGIVLWVYFLLKKGGIGLGIMYCKIIAATGVIIAGASLSLGMYAAARHYVIPRILHEKSAPAELTLPGSLPVPIVSDSSEKPLPAAGYALGVGRFSSSSVDRDTLSMAEDIIIGELSRLQGAAVADIRVDRGGKSLSRILSGSVENLGSQTIITVKVINVGDSKIIFVADEAFESSTDLGKACRSLAAKIARKI